MGFTPSTNRSEIVSLVLLELGEGGNMLIWCLQPRHWGAICGPENKSLILRFGPPASNSGLVRETQVHDVFIYAAS